MAVLKNLNADTLGQLLDLTSESTVIGRAPECSIVLDKPGVSRLHVEFRHSGQSWQVLDLKSRNKTFLNGKILEPERPYSLNPGDKIKICESEFVFYLVPPPPPAANPIEEIPVTEGNEIGHVHTLDASRSSAVASTIKPEVKLAAILEISRALSSELKIDAIAPKILDSLMQLFAGAERGFLVLIEPETKKLIRKAFKYRPNKKSALNAPSYSDEAPMSISRSIVNHVIGAKKAVLSQDAGNDSNLPTSASIADLKIRSVMCVPLLAPDGEVLGIIQLDTSDRKQFMQDDLDVLAAVASQAAISLQNAKMHESVLARERLDRDLKIAEQVQKRFLPQSLPKVPGYEFFAYYLPTYEVGGDFYDFINLPENQLGVALGDVAGKGVAAALMMAKFSGDARFCLTTEKNPGLAAGVLNNNLCAAGIDEKFITLSLCRLNPATNMLEYASAGHLPLLLRHADGTVEELGEEIAGFPCGVMPDTVYEQKQIELKPGDVVVVYSDGVTDSRSPSEELYDYKDQRRLLRRVQTAGGGAESVGKTILQEIREFSKGHSQADDITLVCFGRV
jgi:serine phosphatase RsbU (regulator of sigma subunit)